MDGISGDNSHERQNSKREEKSNKINIHSKRPPSVGPEN